MEDAALHAFVCELAQGFSDGMSKVGRDIQRAINVIADFGEAITALDPDTLAELLADERCDLDDDPAFARFCDVVRRW